MLRVYAFPAANNWMVTRVGLFNETEVAKLIASLSKFENNCRMEIMGDGNTLNVVRDENGKIISRGTNNELIARLEKELALLTLSGNKEKAMC